MHKRGKYAPIFGLFFAANLVFLSFPSPAGAVEVVVNQSVPIYSFTSAELQAIFTMQKRYWPGQREIKVFTLPDRNQAHKDFVKHGLHMFAHQVRRIWDRMIYSGAGIPPVELSSEEEMTEKIANTPDAIGYLSSKPDNGKVRVVKID